MSTIIRSSTNGYVIADMKKSLLAITASYRIYLVTDEQDGNWYMLKVSPDVAGNGRLDREALILKDIQAEVERIRSLEKPDKPSGAFRYEKCFPRLHETFLLKEQGNRRVNIIEIPATDSVGELYPIQEWRTRDSRRLDPKSSAWIIGRLFKSFTLTHPIGIEVGKIDGANILVNPDMHRALFFDWTQALQHEQYVPPEKVGEEIAQVAAQVFYALGGDVATGTLPYSDQLTDSRYADLLVQFMSGQVRNPDTAAQRFYTLVRDMWEKEFHPFTTIPMNKGEYHG